jgi:hypothetical protein
MSAGQKNKLLDIPQIAGLAKIKLLRNAFREK